MDILEALPDVLTRVNNPLANAAPTLAVMAGLYCLYSGWRAGSSRARHVGTAVCVAIVAYTATLRILLEFEVIGLRRFLELSSVNVPLVFLAFAYLFYSRSLAAEKMRSDRDVVRRFHEEHRASD